MIFPRAKNIGHNLCFCLHCPSKPQRHNVHPDTGLRQKRALFKGFITELWNILLLSCIILSTATAFCTDKTGTLAASFNSNSAHVGDIVCLELKYHLPKGWRLCTDLDIKGIDGLSTVSEKVQSNTIKIRLLVDKLKVLKTGNLAIVCMDKKGKKHILSTGPVSLKVISNLEKKSKNTQLRPICDIIPAKPYWLKISFWIFLAMVSAVLIFSLLWWLKSRKTGIKNTNQVLPPHIEATQRIRDLETGGLFEKGYIKEYYFSLSAILKHYLEAIRGFPAAELTTEEIAKTTQHKEDREIIKLLRDADLIKFSNKTPAPAEKQEHIRAAISYIEVTKPDMEEKLKDTRHPADSITNTEKGRKL